MANRQILADVSGNPFGAEEGPIPIHDHPTRESIAAALAQQKAERVQAAKVLGFEINDHGVILPPLAVAPCMREGCRYEGRARDWKASRAQWKALHLLSNHMERKHPEFVEALRRAKQKES